MCLVDTSGLDVEGTFQMCSKCNWWIHWGKSDPEPAIYPRCSHWFPGHLAPSVYSLNDLEAEISLESASVQMVANLVEEVEEEESSDTGGKGALTQGIH